MWAWMPPCTATTSNSNSKTQGGRNAAVCATACAPSSQRPTVTWISARGPRACPSPQVRVRLGTWKQSQAPKDAAAADAGRAPAARRRLCRHLRPRRRRTRMERWTSLGFWLPLRTRPTRTQILSGTPTGWMKRRTKTKYKCSRAKGRRRPCRLRLPLPIPPRQLPLPLPRPPLHFQLRHNHNRKSLKHPHLQKEDSEGRRPSHPETTHHAHHKPRSTSRVARSRPRARSSWCRAWCIRRTSRVGLIRWLRAPPRSLRAGVANNGAGPVTNNGSGGAARPHPISSSSIDVLGTLLTVAAQATAASLLTGSSDLLARAAGAGSSGGVVGG
ncbi:hypothetical protein B0H16DRAFT_432514 [Mycena metata]|uniref:Uncharacterized protein n=1 Tax=Mycena metata TaxID=1033252 RepID=A0AAD7JK35_9AGAR|nr:hypothetical protein B0H16DRAFT_432514 [Mycena metata]